MNQVSIGLHRVLNYWRIFYRKSRSVHRFGGYFRCFKTKNAVNYLISLLCVSINQSINGRWSKSQPGLGDQDRQVGEAQNMNCECVVSRIQVFGGLMRRSLVYRMLTLSSLYSRYYKGFLYSFSTQGVFISSTSFST